METRKRGIFGRQVTRVNDQRKKIKLEESIKRYPLHPECPFDLLPGEIINHIFGFLPLNDVGMFAMASKKTSLMVQKWIDAGYLKHWSGSCGNTIASSDGLVKLDSRCRSFGLVLKRVSMLFPFDERLELIYATVTKFQKEIIESYPDIGESSILHCMGTMIHTFTSGWDGYECYKVYTFISKEMGIKQSLDAFLAIPMEDLDGSANMQMFLRETLRCIFLDTCVDDAEKAVWIRIISAYLDTSNMARLLILLYGPVREGAINWSFPLEIGSLEDNPEDYIMLAKMISILRRIPNWPPEASLQLLVYITNCPSCWLLRSFALLILPLSVVDKDLVVNYFNVLYNSGRYSTASMLLGLVVMVSRTLIRSDGEIEMGDSTVKDMVMAVVKNPDLPCKKLAIQGMWESIGTLAKNFADTAVFEMLEDDDGVDSIHDLHELLDGLKILTTKIFESLY